MPRLQCGRRFPTPVGRARVGKHRRAEDEYVRPPLRLELVSAAAFAAAKRRGNDGDFDSVDEFVTGVRASEYFRKAFRGRRPGPVWFELVPEPENRYDGCAVAVDLEGERAGYAHFVGGPRFGLFVHLACPPLGRALPCNRAAVIRRPPAIRRRAPCVRTISPPLRRNRRCGHSTRYAGD